MDRGGKYPFDEFFKGFFSDGERHMDEFNKHFEEMMKEMDSMFQNIGNIDINVGWQPPPNQSGFGNRVDMPPGDDVNHPRDTFGVNFFFVPPSFDMPNYQFPTEGGGPAGANDAKSRRDLMFDDADNNAASNKTVGQMPEPGDNKTRFRFLPSLFGGPQRHYPNTPLEPLAGDTDPTNNNSVGWMSQGRSSQSYSFNTGSGWTSSQIQTIRHPDGTVEKTEKRTENGRTCTTVTRTDPSGNTTSSTTCDRPAIGDKPMIDETTKDSNPEPVWPPNGKSDEKFVPKDPGMDTSEVNFFNKLFGFSIFKPKDK